jgi:hypothetical protein
VTGSLPLTPFGVAPNGGERSPLGPPLWQGDLERPAQVEALSQCVLAFLETRRRQLWARLDDRSLPEVEVAMGCWREIRRLGRWELLERYHRLLVRAVLGCGRYGAVVDRAH